MRCMLKSNKTCLRYKQITIISQKISQKIKSIFWKKKKKMNLKSQNFKFNILSKIVFCAFFCYKLELFGVKRSMRHKHKWLNKMACYNVLKNETYAQNYLQKQCNKYSYQICLWLIVYHHHLQKYFCKWTSCWWFIGEINNFI